MSSEKTLKKLQKENDKISKEISRKLYELTEKERYDVWGFINKLVENEIEQEEVCNGN
jgi:hypothetical protein